MGNLLGVSLAHQEKTTNHVLHLLLCMPTLGLWLVPWCFVISMNNRYNDNIQKQMDLVRQYKMQGLSDTDTYRKVIADELANKRRRDCMLLASVTASAVVAGVFCILRELQG